MNGSFCVCVLVASWLAGCPARGADVSRSEPVPSPSWVLEDQYARPHQLGFPRPRAVLLVFADRDSAAEVAAWVTPLYAHYGDRVDILGIAAIGGSVPKFLRGRIRQGFRKASVRPILLDWDNRTSNQFRAQPGQVTVVALDRQGRPVGRATGKATEATIRELRAALDTSPDLQSELR